MRDAPSAISCALPCLRLSLGIAFADSRSIGSVLRATVCIISGSCALDRDSPLDCFRVAPRHHRLALHSRASAWTLVGLVHRVGLCKPFRTGGVLQIYAIKYNVACENGHLIGFGSIAHKGCEQIFYFQKAKIIYEPKVGAEASSREKLPWRFKFQTRGL